MSQFEKHRKGISGNRAAVFMYSVLEVRNKVAVPHVKVTWRQPKCEVEYRVVKGRTVQLNSST